MMEITKKELQELRIKDVFVTEGETLSCRMIYDLIEGHINKRHIMEWCTIQLREMLFMKALLLVAGKKTLTQQLELLGVAHLVKLLKSCRRNMELEHTTWREFLTWACLS